MCWRTLLVMLCVAPWLADNRATLCAQEPKLVPLIEQRHTGRIGTVLLSPDGKFLMTTAEAYPTLSNLAGERLRIFKDSWYPAGFSNDSKLLLLSSESRCEIWNLATGTKLPRIAELEFPCCPVLSGDGKYVASGNPRDNNYAVWDLATGKQLQNFSGHTDYIKCAVFSPDGKTLFTGSADRSVIAWNLITGNKTQALLDHLGEIESLSLSKDGKLLVVNTRVQVTLYNVDKWEKLNQLGDSNKPINTSLITPDGKTLLLATQDGNITLWNLSKGAPLRTITAIKHAIDPRYPPSMQYVAQRDGDQIQQLSLSMDSRVLLVRTSRGNATLWDFAKGAPLRSLNSPRDELNGFSLSKDGKIVAVRYSETGVSYWNLQNGERLKTPELLLKDYGSMALSSDGKYLISSIRNTIDIWNASTGGSVKKLEVPSKDERVFTLDLTPDNKMLVTGLYSGTAILWNIADGQILRLLRGHQKPINNISFSADGKTLATQCQDMVIVWNPENGDKLATINGHREYISCFQLSRDGKTLATGSGDKTAILWDVATGNIRQTFDCLHSVSRVVFSPDEKSLFVATIYGKLIRWDLATGKRQFITDNGLGRPIGMAMTNDGKFTILANQDKFNIQLYDAETGKERLALHAQGPDWVAITPSGKLDGSPNGLKSLALVQVGDTNEYQSIERHRAKFVVPKLLDKILRGEPLEADAAKAGAK